MQLSQGDSNTASRNEPEEAEAICDQTVTCITPQWPPATQKMKRHVRMRPVRFNTIKDYFMISGCGQRQSQRVWQRAD